MNKAVGMANISGRCFKNGANKLATTQICSLSIKPSRSPNNSKLAKFKPLYKTKLDSLPFTYSLKNCRENITQLNI